MGTRNRQFVLQQIPKERLSADDFRLVTGNRPPLTAGGVVVKTRYISLDAANRAWMQGATYRDAISADQVMVGYALAEVVESDVCGLEPGDLVFCDTGWQEWASIGGEGLTVLPRCEPLSHLLSVFGVAGLTAYFGLLRCGQPAPGETVVVSAAAGAVGSLVGQIAKIMGCRAVGIAGGSEKVAWLTGELGFDAAVDYRADDFKMKLKTACPNGIDVYFDNVAGEVLESCLFAMNPFGRIVCCGAVSQYDGAAPKAGPRGVPGLIVTRRLTMQGFILSDFDREREVALTDLRNWVAAGRIKVQEDVIVGFEKLPDALVGLLNGENRGKRMVKV